MKINSIILPIALGVLILITLYMVLKLTYFNYNKDIQKGTYLRELFDEKEALKQAEIAAYEVEQHKKTIELYHKTIQNTKKQLGEELSEKYQQEFINILNLMKEEYKKAEAAQKRAQIASPTSLPAVKSKQTLDYLQRLIESVKI
jgi:hypothetical protein